MRFRCAGMVVGYIVENRRKVVFVCSVLLRERVKIFVSVCNGQVGLSAVWVCVVLIIDVIALLYLTCLPICGR